MWEIIRDINGSKIICEGILNNDCDREPLENYKSLLLDADQILFPLEYHFSIPELPDNIKSIIINNVREKLEFKLPQYLEILNIYSCDNYYKVSEFPKTLKSLSWFCKTINGVKTSLNILPDWIEELCISIPFTCYDLSHFKNLKIFKIMDTKFNQSLDCLPNTLEYLEINCNVYDQPLDNLPIFLKELRINSKYIQLLDYLPSNLKKLTLLNYCGKSLDHLPNNLEYLLIGYQNNFNNLILNNLPDSITTIEFGSNELLHLREHTFKVPKKCNEICYNSEININIDDHKFLITQKGLKISNRYYNI